MFLTLLAPGEAPSAARGGGDARAVVGDRRAGGDRARDERENDPVRRDGGDLDSFLAGVGGGTYFSGPRSSGTGGGRFERTCQLPLGASRIVDGDSTGATLRSGPEGVADGMRVGVGVPTGAVLNVRPAVLTELAFAGETVAGAASNIFIKFETRALPGVPLGDATERFDAGVSSAEPERFVGVTRRCW